MDAAFALVGLAVGALLSFISNYFSQRAEQATQFRIDTAEKNLEEQPEKAKPAWDLARATLDAYFKRNLGQITAIFWLSVAVMISGFAVIIWGISQSVQAPDTLGPATIATFAGLVTEFIGATFLYIYRSTVRQAMEYSRTLERINSVGMALQILDTIDDEATTAEANLKNKTKAQLVQDIMRQVYDSSASQRNTSA